MKNKKIVIIIVMIVLIIVLVLKNIHNRNVNIDKREISKEQLTEIDKSITMALLWENASPDSKIADGTTITLSSNDYNWLYVESKFSNTDDVTISKVTGSIMKGQSLRLTGIGSSTAGNALTASRTFKYVNDTTYTVGTGWRSLSGGSPSENTNYIIPYRIYGIK